MSIRQLQEFTNIIPVLAKGDSFNVKEVKEVKSNIIERAEELGI